MATAPPVVSIEKSKTFVAIFLSGLTAGALDITAAFINSGLRGGTPARVLRFIASGLLGVDALKGGLGTAALGAACHFLIAFTAATVYYLASRKLSFMIEHAVISGIFYGIAVYLFMSRIVVPLSRAPAGKPTVTSVLLAAAIIIVCVGLPIALITRHYSK